MGWRSTFYFLAIVGAILLLYVTFLLPETVRRKREEVLPTFDERGQAILKPPEKFKALKIMRTAFAPMITMLSDPTVLMITLYNTIVFASLFFLVSLTVNSTNLVNIINTQTLYV